MLSPIHAFVDVILSFCRWEWWDIALHLRTYLFIRMYAILVSRSWDHAQFAPAQSKQVAPKRPD